jgi:hypothetical protein
MSRRIGTALLTTLVSLGVALAGAPAHAAAFSSVCQTVFYSDGAAAARPCISKELGTAPQWFVNDRSLGNPDVAHGGHTDQTYNISFHGNGHVLWVDNVGDGGTLHTASATWTEGNNTVWAQFTTTYIPWTDCFRVFFARNGDTSATYVHNCPA